MNRRQVWHCRIQGGVGLALQAVALVLLKTGKASPIECMSWSFMGLVVGMPAFTLIAVFGGKK